MLHENNWFAFKSFVFFSIHTIKQPNHHRQVIEVQTYMLPALQIIEEILPQKSERIK